MNNFAGREADGPATGLAVAAGVAITTTHLAAGRGDFEVPVSVSTR
jgi:hypothetical protein